MKSSAVKPQSTSLPEGNPLSPQVRRMGSFLRKFPSNLKGKRRIASFLLGDLSREKDVLLELENGFRFVVPNLVEPVSRELLEHGAYEKETLDLLAKRLKKGSVFIDVGGNIGAISIPAARMVGDKGVVISFEPSPVARPYLYRNIALNEATAIEVIEGAAFFEDRKGLEFFAPPAESFGMGALSDMYGHSPMAVEGFTIDSVLSQRKIDKVDAIKIDVLGLEGAVLAGAKKLLSGKNPPIILFEKYPWTQEHLRVEYQMDPIGLLSGLGFRFYELVPYLKGKGPITDLSTIIDGNYVALRD